MNIQFTILKTQNHGSKFKVYKRIFHFATLIIILLFAFFILHLEMASAAGASLKLSPSLLQIKAIAPADINAPVTIENISDAPVSLSIQYKLFRTSDKENGQVKFLSDKDNHSEIFNKIQLIDNNQPISSLDLGPEEKKNLDLRISLSENEMAKDYYFSIIFVTRPKTPNQTQTNPQAQNSFSIISGGVAMNVLLSVDSNSKDLSQALGIIQKFSAPSFIESGPVAFTVKVQNNSSHYINPKGAITIKNMFGQTTGKVDIPSQDILTNSSRYLLSNQLITHSSSLATPKVVWGENLLIGPYTAELNLQLSDKGPTLTQTTNFTAFPTKLIIGFVITILLFCLIYFRVKEKMKSQ